MNNVIQFGCQEINLVLSVSTFEFKEHSVVNLLIPWFILVRDRYRYRSFCPLVQLGCKTGANWYKCNGSLGVATASKGVLM